MRTLCCLSAASWLFLASIPAASAAAVVVAPERPLSELERGELLRGELVSRPMRFHSVHGSYLGGLSYSLVEAPASEVLGILSNVETLPHALPSTRSARLIDVRGRQARVELVQGSGPLQAEYTVRLERVPGRPELRFWLDPLRPHDIVDVFGYFRVEPFGAGRCLVTLAVALDLGSGVASFFFSDAIQKVVLSAPQFLRAYVKPRAARL